MIAGVSMGGYGSLSHYLKNVDKIYIFSIIFYEISQKTQDNRRIKTSINFDEWKNYGNMNMRKKYFLKIASKKKRANERKNE